MNKKIIALSLLLMNLKMVCGENQVVPKAVPCFEISYSDKRVNELSLPGFKHSKYGFESHPLTLTYTEKTERAVISLNGKILQRLKMPKEQFAKIATTVKDGFSIDRLEYNKEFPLKSPLYVIAQEPNAFISYKISYLNQRKPSEVDEAGYNSGLENRQESFFAGGAVGMCFGIVIGGSIVTFLVFAAAIKKYLFS